MLTLQITSLQPGSTALPGAYVAAESMCNGVRHFTWAVQHVYSAICFEACASSHPIIAKSLLAMATHSLVSRMNVQVWGMRVTQQEKRRPDLRPS